MKRVLGSVWGFLANFWERLLFAFVGFASLLFAFRFLSSGDITAASATFAVAFFSFFYSNLARFKRFKGLGFEAELWEDKQKEAEDLIHRLKNVVSIYTREIITNNVMRGRWSSGSAWPERWRLFAELVEKHNELGQEIDFSDLKRKIDGIFLFDVCQPLSTSVRQPIEAAKSEARDKINEEFGNPIKDLEGYNRRVQELNAIRPVLKDLFIRSEKENIAQAILDNAQLAANVLKDSFSINVDYEATTIEKLETVARLHKNRPLDVTPELIAMADEQK